MVGCVKRSVLDKPRMLSVLDYLEIRKSYAAGESMNSIAERLGHYQKTVSAVIRPTTGAP